MKTKFFATLIFAACYFFQHANAQSDNEVQATPVTREASRTPGITVSPNPSTGKFLVQFDAAIAGKGGITVTDKEGNGVVSIEFVATVGKNSVPVSLASYGPGNYKVSVSAPELSGTTQVVIQRSK